MTSEIQRHEIEDCLAHFFDRMDLKQYDRLRDTFTSDGVFTFAFSRQDRIDNVMAATAEGNGNIGDLITQSFASVEQTHHTFSNVNSWQADGRIKARAHIRAYHQGKGVAEGLFEESLAIAELDMERVGVEVLIKQFDYTVLIVLGSKAVFSEVEFGQ